jgi:CubicO group peptidase (beta-lactamase class C family)
MFSRTYTKSKLLGLFAALAATVPAARAVPITGMPVAELAIFDQVMSDFMDNNGIEAGLLGIMKDGVIVYQRGFGWKDSGHTTLLRHDALMRIASCTKPFTAAATQKLIAGGFLDPNDFVFDLGQPGGGILQPGTYAPFPALGDTRFAQTRLKDLYGHRGGWDRNITPDPTYKEVQIADDFNDANIPTSYPPGRVKTVRWIMGQPLDFTPGTQRQYSNVGFLLLGLIVEQISGTNHLSYLRNNVIGPLDWAPVTELVQGRTFPGDRDPREPWYDDDAMVQNVFDPDGPAVRRPDGGWDHEARIGQGGIACSTTMMLHLAENYYISDNQNSDPTYGLPTDGVRDDRWHNGAMPGGTMSMLVQRSDGINFAVIFNKNGNDVNSPDPNNPTGYHFAIKAAIEDAIDAGGFTWPAQGVDGQWTDFNEVGVGDGSFEDPWNDVPTTLAQIADEGTVNIKPSTSDWTGVINQKVRIRAPLGTAVIGQQ